MDTDFAGCHRTRRSTSGGIAMVGGHVIKAWSTTQPTVALSSGEAELTGIVKGASQGIGLQSISSDLGIKKPLTIHTDATAAIGICRRRGLGKIRHLAVADLWIQDKVKTGELTLVKVAGSENPADMVTKYVEGRLLEKHIKAINLQVEEGRAAAAPQLPANENS